MDRTFPGSTIIIIMLNLFSLKEKKEEGAKGAGTKKKASAAQLRITKVWPPLKLLNWFSGLLWFVFLQDINELELPKTCKTEFPDPDDLLSFKLIIYPDEVKLKPADSKKDIKIIF